jgi:DNA-binding transcriptional LysR family regulator
VRNKRHVRLTPAGAVLLEGARELLRLAESVEERIASLPCSASIDDISVVALRPIRS